MQHSFIEICLVLPIFHCPVPFIHLEFICISQAPFYIIVCIDVVS